jgi:hypothetical protein
MGPAATRYAQSADVMIAYQVVGSGPFDVVLTPPRPDLPQIACAAVLPDLPQSGPFVAPASERDDRVAQGEASIG